MKSGATAEIMLAMERCYGALFTTLRIENIALDLVAAINTLAAEGCS